MRHSQYLILLLIIVFTTSCAMMGNQRTFLDEMDQEENFFVANRDFRVAAGDGSNGHRSQEEIMERTPLDGPDQEKLIANKRLSAELNKLYQAQSDFAQRHFHRYEGYIQTVSEKIFFLRLESLDERNEYLYSKGAPIHRDLENMSFRRPAGELFLGMRKSEVIQTWGRPTRRDVAGNPTHENERWAYFESGKIRFVYFEAGKVQGWSLPD